MVAATVPAVYADALLSAAQEAGCLSDVQEDAGELLVSLRESGDLITLIENPELNREKGKEILGKALASCVEPMLANFLRLLIDRDRFGQVIDILEEVVRQAEVLAGVLEIEVTSAVVLDEATRASITEALKRVHGEGVRVRWDEDPSLITGMRLRIGEQLVDTSARHHLSQMKSLIAEAPLHGVWE